MTGSLHSSAPVALIIGAGPGIGRSVAKRFAQEGYAIALVARTQATLSTVAESLRAEGVDIRKYQADSGDETALRAALDAAADDLGVPDVLVYNAAVIRADEAGELSIRDHLESWSVNVLGAMAAIEHLAPRMKRAGGTCIVTGGMPEPDPRYVSLSLGKVGVRALVEMLAARHGPDGIHVATVTVGGAVAPGTAYDPDEIASHYVRLHDQPRAEWETLVELIAEDRHPRSRTSRIVRA